MSLCFVEKKKNRKERNSEAYQKKNGKKDH